MKNTSVLFLIFASLPATLLAVCPNPMPATFDNVACVNVVESGFSTNSPVVSATSFWDSAACGDDGGAGHDFPYRLPHVGEEVVVGGDADPDNAMNLISAEHKVFFVMDGTIFKGARKPENWRQISVTDLERLLNPVRSPS